jgi:hypothetical protein
MMRKRDGPGPSMATCFEGIMSGNIMSFNEGMVS